MLLSVLHMNLSFHFSLVGLCPPGQYHTVVNDVWACSECDIGYYQTRTGYASVGGAPEALR